MTTGFNITTASADTTPSTILLGFGPQAMDWLSKAAKITGKQAVVDPDVARMASANFAVGMPYALAALRQRLEPGALAHVRSTTPNAPPGAIEWLACGHRGLSSEALFTRLTGIKTNDDARSAAHPYDPSDLRRCRLMLEAVPSLQPLLPQARDLSSTWAALIDAWPELCALMDEEFPSWRGKIARGGVRLYERMKQLTGRAA